MGFMAMFLYLFLAPFLCYLTMAPLFAMNGQGLAKQDLLQVLWKNNTAIRLGQLDYHMALAEKQMARQELDYHLELGIFRKNDVEKTNSTLDRGVLKEETTGLSLGLKKDFSRGIQGEFGLEALKTETDSTTAFSPSRYQPVALARLGIPILKGGSRDEKINRLRKAHFRVLQYREKLKLKVLEEYDETLQLIWELYRVYGSLKVRKEALKNYRDILQMRVTGKDGLSAKAGLFQQEMKIQEEESSILDLDLKLAKKIFSLSEEREPFLAWEPPFGEEALEKWGEEGLLEKDREGKDIRPPESHPSLELLDFQVKESQVEVNKSKRARRPQLDLNVEVKSSGLGRPAIDPLEDVAELKHPSYEFILLIRFPLENLTARGDYQEKMNQHLKLEYQRNKEALTLLTDLKGERRRLEILLQEHRSTGERMSDEERKLVLKRDLYKGGFISLQELSQAILDLQELKLSKIDLFVAWKKEYLKFLRSSNQLVGRAEWEAFLSDLPAPGESP